MGLLGKTRRGLRTLPDTLPVSTQTATPWRTRVVRAVCVGLVAAVIIVLIAASVRARSRRLSSAARVRARCRSTNPDAARRTIFVSIVARGHRDEQATVALIGALFDRARHPGRVHVGLCRCSSRGYGDDQYSRDHTDGHVGGHNGDDIDDIVAAYGAAYPHHEGRFNTNVRVLTEEPTSERGAANAMLLVQRHLYRGQRYYATISVNCRPCHGWDVAALSDLDRAALHQTSTTNRSMTPTAKVIVTMRLADDSDSDDEDSTDDSDDYPLGDDDAGEHHRYDADADGAASIARTETSDRGHGGGSFSVTRIRTGNDRAHRVDHAKGSTRATATTMDRDNADKNMNTLWPSFFRNRGRRQGTLSASTQPGTRSAQTPFGRQTTNQKSDVRSAHHRLPTFAVFEMWSPRGLPVLRTRAFRYAPVRPFGTPFWHSDFSLCDAAALVGDAPWDPWYEHLPLDGAVDWCTTVRLWTRGWDFYSPTRALVRRTKGRTRDACLDSPVDLPRRVRREREAAYARAWALLGLEVPWRPSIEPRYALGTVRAVAAFMRQSGLDWLERRADAHAFVGMLPLGDAGVGVAVRFDEREVAAKYGSWARFLDETDYRGGVAVHW
nr:N-acetyl-glucosamine transferase incomplete domain containing protein [Pandoravirus aubagnensis]